MNILRWLEDYFFGGTTTTGARIIAFGMCVVVPVLAATLLMSCIKFL